MRLTAGLRSPSRRVQLNDSVFELTHSLKSLACAVAGDQTKDLMPWPCCARVRVRVVVLVRGPPPRRYCVWRVCSDDPLMQPTARVAVSVARARTPPLTPAMAPRCCVWRSLCREYRPEGELVAAQQQLSPEARAAALSHAWRFVRSRAHLQRWRRRRRRRRPLRHARQAASSRPRSTSEWRSAREWARRGPFAQPHGQRQRRAFARVMARARCRPPRPRPKPWSCVQVGAQCTLDQEHPDVGKAAVR